MKLSSEVCVRLAHFCLCVSNCLPTLALLLFFTVNSTPGWSLCFCFNSLMLVSVAGHWTGWGGEVKKSPPLLWRSHRTIKDRGKKSRWGLSMSDLFLCLAEGKSRNDVFLIKLIFNDWILLEMSNIALDLPISFKQMWVCVFIIVGLTNTYMR